MARFLNSSNVRRLIGKQVTWKAPGYNRQYEGADIILGVDFSKPMPIITKTVWGDDLSYAFLTNHSLVENEDGIITSSDVTPYCFAYTDEDREVVVTETTEPWQFKRVDVCLRHRVDYATSMTTSEVLLDMAADAAEECPDKHHDGLGGFYVTRNKHYYKKGAEDYYPDGVVEPLDADGKKVKEIKDAVFFTDKEDAVNFAKDLLADAKGWNDYNHLGIVQSQAFGEMAMYGDNIPADGLGYGEWWEFLVHDVTVDSEADNLRNATKIEDVIVNDDDDEYLGVFVVDNPIK